ncbi:helix-turn-helix transcriptional regulator [Nocardia sp. 2]|uniref:Helix-turn-helix transcriptional regulator n=1 Tax=Nocardia acididurans TaxID=2802282 RepID=A0ABS1MD55_9NOCA|nr:helix-turn-helix transcriptional regulator [Nocardia acididurans]MBL1078216.1 helix-turn-helix transcriptional regulator [Nocardia acididurans]
MSRSASDGEPVGERVRRLRKDRDLTQQQLADLVAVSRSLVQQIENGKRIPPLALRERLSAALGEQLLTGQEAGDVGSDLRMRFNILLGKDPQTVERVLDIAQSLVDAASARDTVEPLREIAERQLERAEEVLTQIPSGSAQVWEWNTIHDWLTVLGRARDSVCAIHTADLGTISGDVGDDYHERILQLAGDAVEVRRLYVIDKIDDVFPYEDKLWQQARTGVETVLVPRELAPNAQSMLVVDESYVATGEYAYSRRERIVTRFSSLKHDIQFAIRRFEQLYKLRSAGMAIAVNDVIADASLTRYHSLAQDDCRNGFRAALRQAWARAGESPVEGARR